LVSRIYRRNPAIEAAPLQGESILFDPASNRFCLLNGTAAFVWDRLVTPATVEEISTEICQQFAVPEPARVQDDVRTALQKFAELALVAADPVP
jgi:hypothetical protein